MRPTTPSPDDRRTLTVAEAAAQLGVSLPLVYGAARSGALPSVRVGARVLIPRAAFEAWLRGERGSSLREPAA